jgi:hypothetical protein
MEVCEINQRKDYPSGYEAMARLVGSVRLEPSASELEFISLLSTGRFYSHGSLGNADIFFLSALIGALGARNALEIGAASGLSAALIVATIARGFEERGEPVSGTLAHTIDRQERCLFNENKPIGFVIPEIVPALADRVEVHTNSDSSSSEKYAGKESLTFAFIDGNHQHPWPLLDALHLLPLMRPGSWMAMHDIANPPGREAAQVRMGAQWVFDEWPARTIKGGYIGAVQVPERRSALKGFIEGLLKHPFEVSESGWKKYRKRVEEAAQKALAD